MWVDNTEFCWTREDVKIAPSRNQNDIGRRTTLSTSFWSSMIFVRTPLRVFTIGPDQNLNSLVETGLPGWACKIRTGESAGELSDWNCVATSPEGGAIKATETLRVRAA
jgi:hypothetical protein